MFLFLITLGYLMGSCCSAIIVCRLFSLPDPRTEGSKNPGTTNVLRIAGKQYALIVMLGDLLKGTIPVLIAQALHATPSTIAYTALAAVLGHMYPVFFKFKGGKGVATTIGVLLGLHFLIGVMVMAIWLLVAHFNRHASFASIVSIAFAPFFSLFFTRRLDTFTPLFIILILVLIKHRGNIMRLIEGTEPKVNFKTNLIKEIMKPTTRIPPDNLEKFIAEETILVPEEPTEEVKPKVSTAKPAKKKAATKTKT